MAPRIEYIKDENSDRAYPNAFIVDEAMFKVNGEYVCVEPCGGGGHLFGDQYIYVSSDGSDSSMVGSETNPFLTIFRAMEYVMSIDVVGGDIFVVFQDEGPFYINETVIINHQNKIHWIGNEYV